MSRLPATRRLLWWGAVGSVTLCAIVWCASQVFSWWLSPPTGFRWEQYDSPSFRGSPRSSGTAPTLSIGSVMGRGDIESRSFGIVWKGEWFVSRAGEYEFVLAARDGAVLKIGGASVIRRNARLGYGPQPRALSLTPGFYRVEVVYRHERGPADLRLTQAVAGSSPSPFPPDRVFTERPGATRWWMYRNIQRLRWIAVLGALTPLLLTALIALWRLGAHALTTSPPEARRRIMGGSGMLLAMLVLLFGWAFRFDALLQKYGPLRAPGWVASAGGVARVLSAPLRRLGLIWPHAEYVDHPYDGGDPASYLTNARRMRSFYDTAYREPVHIAATKAFLLLLDDSSLAPSFASMAASTLALLATFLLGRAAFSVGVGLVAAALLALESMVIGWGVDGWRDDAFMLFVTVTAFGTIRFVQSPTTARAVVLGILSGLCLLTRITALSFILPAFGWAAFATTSVPWRRRCELLVAAGAIAAAWVLPLLVSCALEYGDPLMSINFAPGFYRERAGQTAVENEGVVHYVWSRFATAPVKTAATMIEGSLVVPLRNKWEGFRYLSPYLPRFLLWSAVAGLVVWLTSPSGRILLMITLASLLPYSLTWDIPGGGEWRFTQHAYPLFLIAACSLHATLLGSLLKLRPDRRR